MSTDDLADEKVAAAHIDHSQADAANEQEKAIKIRDVLKKHPSLVWWIFYWAMAAVGWGFDAQINGAMISVPAFRREFGCVSHIVLSIHPHKRNRWSY